MIPHTGSKLKVTLWASETPEWFILHVRSAIHACKQLEDDVKFSKAEDAVANAILDLEIQKDEYAQVHNSEKKAKGNKGESAPAASKSLVAAKAAYEKAKQALDAVKLAVTMEGAKAFNLYGNLLSNGARRP